MFVVFDSVLLVLLGLVGAGQEQVLLAEDEVLLGLDGLKGSSTGRDEEIAEVVYFLVVWVKQLVNKERSILRFRSQPSIQHILAVLAFDEVLQVEQALV